MFTIISILQELIKRGWNNSERYGNFSKIDKPGGWGALFGTAEKTFVTRNLVSSP